MAAIGSCWATGSWISVGGWAANTWANAVAPVISAVKHYRDRRRVGRRRFL